MHQSVSAILSSIPLYIILLLSNAETREICSGVLLNMFLIDGSCLYVFKLKTALSDTAKHFPYVFHRRSLHSI